jgi:hypothetical protein
MTSGIRCSLFKSEVYRFFLDCLHRTSYIVHIYMKLIGLSGIDVYTGLDCIGEVSKCYVNFLVVALTAKKLFSLQITQRRK